MRPPAKNVNMKKVLLLAVFSFLLFGCNVNPSKEARLQKLETEIQQSMDKISALEKSVQMLSDENEQLKARLLKVEER